TEVLSGISVDLGFEFGERAVESGLAGEGEHFSLDARELLLADSVNFLGLQVGGGIAPDQGGVFLLAAGKRTETNDGPFMSGVGAGHVVAEFAPGGLELLFISGGTFRAKLGLLVSGNVGREAAKSGEKPRFRGVLRQLGIELRNHQI